MWVPPASRRSNSGKRARALKSPHLGLEPIAPDLVVDSMIVDSGQVSSSIAKLFNENMIKSKSVATAVSGHSVIVKKISLPSMSDQELADTIQKEAAQHIPFDLADVNLDYQILSDDATSPHMDVLLVAVKKDKILNYTNVLSMAGKTPAIVDIDALALQNCYEYNYEPAPTQVVALLNLGASVMNINIVKGTTPLFPRDVSVGGHQYTDSLQKELDLSFDDAEALKLGKKAGAVQEDAKTPDSPAGHRDHSARNSEDLRLFPRQRCWRAYRENLPGRGIGPGSRSGRSVAPGILHARRTAQPVPEDRRSRGRSWGAIGRAERRTIGGRRWPRP